MIEKLVNQISTVERFYVCCSTSVALHREVTVDISRKENIAHHHLFLMGSEYIRSKRVFRDSSKADIFEVLPKFYYYHTLAVNHDT